MPNLIDKARAPSDGGQEELSVEHHWFRVVQSMVLHDKIAEMGANAWAVYCVLKAYAGQGSEASWPGQERIAMHIGASDDTVRRALERLLELKIVEKRRVGRRSEYALLESTASEVATDEILVASDRAQQPAAFEGFLREIKDFAKSGELASDGNLKIVLNVNLVSGSHATVYFNKGEMADGLTRSHSAALTRDLRHLGD